MNVHAKKASSAIAIIAASLLSACGGGGGGGSGGSTTASTQAPSAITSANAPDVAANAYAAEGVINGQANGGPGFITPIAAAAVINGQATSGSTLIASTSTGLSSTATKGVIHATLQQIYKVLGEKSAGNLPVGATVSQQYSCSTSGTVTYVITEATSGVVSNGDDISMTANKCVEDNVESNGNLKVGFGSISGTPSSTSAWNATLDVTYTNFKVTEGTDSVTMQGNMTIGVNQVSSTNVSLTANGASFSVIATSGAITTSETLSAFTYSGSYIAGVYTYGSEFTMDGTFPNLGIASYVVKVNTPLKQTGSDYPYQGSITVTAADHSSLKLNAVDSVNVRIEIDKNGDGVYEEATTTTWAALASRL